MQSRLTRVAHLGKKIRRGSVSQVKDLITGRLRPLTSKEVKLTTAMENRCAIFLLRFRPMLRGRFKTGGMIPQSGIYRVYHRSHRLPHEVTLLKGEKFPKCQKCSEGVSFKLIRGLSYQKAIKDSSWRVALYELPVLESDLPSTKTG